MHGHTYIKSITLISQLYLNYGIAQRERLSLRPLGSVSWCLLTSHSFNALGTTPTTKQQACSASVTQGKGGEILVTVTGLHTQICAWNLKTLKGAVCPSIVAVCAVPWFMDGINLTIFATFLGKRGWYLVLDTKRKKRFSMVKAGNSETERVMGVTESR